MGGQYLRGDSAHGCCGYDRLWLGLFLLKGIYPQPQLPEFFHCVGWRRAVSREAHEGRQYGCCCKQSK
jgi:hypothetical protein